MTPINLFFDFRDLARSPRLALSGKKIWIFIVGNLAGFLGYWLFSYLSIILSGISLNAALAKYGLYPCLFGNETAWYCWGIYFIGILIWFLAILLSSTAVSRVTLKQLKGNDFYSSRDAWSFVFKHWKAVIFSPITISLIILFFLLFSGFFAALSSIPYLGKFLFILPYIIYFFGALFTIYTFFVLGVSIIYSPYIVGVYEEDTMGTVFHSYSITIGQPWRIILYHLLLIPIIILSVEIFSWFWINSIGFINMIFGHELFMGEKLTNIVYHASKIVCPDWLYETIFWIKNAVFNLFGFSYTIPNIFSNYIIPEPINLSSIDTLHGSILAIPYFIIGLSIISYGLAIFSVGQTLMFIIFKKISDNDNLLLRKDDDEIDDEIEDDFDFEQSITDNPSTENPDNNNPKNNSRDTE